MKKLEPLSATRLSNLEFGQHVKSIKDGIGALGGIVADAPLVSYLASLSTSSTNYDRAMVQVFKSDETIRIQKADGVRDMAVSALKRMLFVYELSENANEQLAFASLQTMFNTYGNIQEANYEAETNAITNLLVDLGNTHYLPHVTLLNLGAYVTRMQTANIAFTALFAGRTQETAAKEVFDVKQMRSDMKNIYSDMAEYVLSMSKARNTAEFNKSLDVINTVRKYYSNLLAKRQPAKKGEAETPIPPME